MDPHKAVASLLTPTPHLRSFMKNKAFTSNGHSPKPTTCCVHYWQWLQQLKAQGFSSRWVIHVSTGSALGNRKRAPSCKYKQNNTGKIKTCVNIGHRLMGWFSTLKVKRTNKKTHRERAATRYWDKQSSIKPRDDINNGSRDTAADKIREFIMFFSTTTSNKRVDNSSLANHDFWPRVFKFNMGLGQFNYLTQCQSYPGLARISISTLRHLFVVN